MTEKWLWMTAAELGRGIAAGDIDPVALTETYLDAIGGHAVADRIFARLTRSRALAESRAAADRARSGQRRGPLDGVPISWKDLFDTAGDGTEAGSRLLQGRVPDRDAECLARATAAGLICLGKTHMSELAFSGLGVNPKTATPPNVNDPDCAPGGSSSGAAASVAFGLSAAGIGSDTGGSVRIPSAWNDLVGLKTTSGLIPLTGVVPLCESFDTVGPLCRSTEDAALLLEALCGLSADLTGASLAGRRFAVCRTVALDDVEDAPARGFEAALSRLSAAGAVIEDIDLPCVAEAMPLSPVLFTVEAYAQWGREIEARGDVMYAEIRQRFESGMSFSGVEYVRAQKKLAALRRDYAAATAGYDAVLAPTAPIAPPNVKRLSEDSDYYVHANLMTLRNTRIGNLMGLPGLTLPTGVPGAGVMLLAPAFAEARLLRLGAAAEAALAA